MPGTRAEPETPPFTSASRESIRSSAWTTGPAWQLRHDAWRIGRTSRSKSTGAVWGRAVVARVATPARSKAVCLGPSCRRVYGQRDRPHRRGGLASPASAFTTGGGLPRIRPTMLMRPLAVAAFLPCLLLPGAKLGAEPPKTDVRNERTPNTDSRMAMPEFRSVAEWEARRARLRTQILAAAGLLPLPERTPLRPQVFGRLEREGYTVEKVLLETLPGFYLGGNLYRPRGAGARHPGVLSPHGHWNYGRLEHQPPAEPTLGAILARQGYVVFNYDMVGYNDTVQTPHSFGGPRETSGRSGPWACSSGTRIRALDFLQSLADVDPDRIGLTGASGGGTQTFLLYAVDERMRCAAPVNMISGYHAGR